MKIEPGDKTLIWIGAYAIASIVKLAKATTSSDNDPKNIDTEASNFADRVSKTVEKKLKDTKEER